MTSTHPRRAFLGGSVLSLGSIASFKPDGSTWLGRPVADRRLHWARTSRPTRSGDGATATRVIMIFAAGGLSQLDLFDEKPLLNNRRGEELPDSSAKARHYRSHRKAGSAAGGRFVFQVQAVRQKRPPHVRALPGDGCRADDTRLGRSVQTDHVLHEAAMSIFFTGTMQLSAALVGLMGDVRPREREQGPSRSSW